jgi:drug/metabolite transporter (DMT)-like permease
VTAQEEKLKTNKRIEFLSIVGLLCAALFWGISFPAMKVVEDLPTFYIISIRFLVASIALVIIFYKRFRNYNRQILKYAFLLSFCIFSMYIFCTVGIKYTTSARASFFSCLTFAIVPFLNLIIYKLRLTKITMISVLICLAGVFLLSYTSDIGGFSLNIGDILCILGSLAGSFHITFLERVTNKEGMDSILFTVFLMSFIAVWGTLAAIFTGSFANIAPAPFLMGTIVFIGLFCTAAAFLFQSICQKYVPSNRVGIVLAMEPASGCIFSVIFLGETLSVYGWVGASLVMASLLYMELATGRESERNRKAENPVA